MLSDYRQRFGEYHSELHREDFLFRSGRRTSHDVVHIHSEFSDLFRLSTVEELRAKLNDVSESRKTERAAIGRLIAFALEGNLLVRVHDVSKEIADYEATSKFDWYGKKLAFFQSEELLATEPDPQLRRELHARQADIVKGAQDLLAERFATLRTGAGQLGFESYVAMRRELRGVDLDALATKAKQLLSKTESQYVSELAPLLLREANVSIDEATAADLPYLRRYTRFDVFFPREQMLRIYRQLFANFGFNPDKQTNVELDAAVRTGKQRRAFCSPIRIPDEIKLVVQPTDGQLQYGEFLSAAGKAQLAAWTSRNLPPEFQRCGDAAVPMAWAMLLENLLLEEAWLTGTLGFVANAEFRRALSLFRLLELRREAAWLNYELEFHSGNLTSGIGERYAELMTDALRVRVDEADCLRAVSDDFRPAAVLRAAAFEAQLRDFLRTKFGSRWWTSRKAGEMLIDLWNTGQQYSVEELAAMIGLGELDFESFTAELLKQIG